ncbi:pectinesterase family protein [Streptomyces sp. NRRL F-5123]|uniref:pectinesterase family protein n=1 Tax=Streptomyces sp. NRRL F-5123 TaxID=1463856 RepID=UPI0004E0F850|nr:pectinesterase family protein [Streptomyces sp. NRRL F-5123]
MFPSRRVSAVTSALAGVLCAAGLIASPAHAAGVTLTVAHTGAQFSSIQSAVNAVPDNSSTPYTISIAAGTYAEYLTVPATKLHLTMLGATGNPADVRIDGSRYNGLAKPGGGTYGTEGSATVHVKADGFTAQHLTFRNLFSRQANPSVTGTQAVALAMEGDRQTYLDCDFYGHQDTLLSWNSTAARSLRQYVRGGEVDGDVDFIFGNGTLVVDRSHINLLSDDGFTSGYLAAPATFGSNRYGILLTGDTVTSTFAAGRLYLGRAWKPSGDAVPQMVVRQTSLPAAIRTDGPWTGISGATWTPGRYGEYANTGPGATVNSARPQLSAADAAAFTAAAYLAGGDGWNPAQ